MFVKEIERDLFLLHKVVAILIRNSLGLQFFRLHGSLGRESCRVDFVRCYLRLCFRQL